MHSLQSVSQRSSLVLTRSRKHKPEWETLESLKAWIFIPKKRRRNKFFRCFYFSPPTFFAERSSKTKKSFFLSWFCPFSHCLPPTLFCFIRAQARRIYRRIQLSFGSFLGPFCPRFVCARVYSVNTSTKTQEIRKRRRKRKKFSVFLICFCLLASTDEPKKSPTRYFN